MATEPVRRYALVVGINRYQSDNIAALSYAQQDARSMEELLNQLGFSVRSLLGRQATQAALEAELTALSSLPPETADLLILYFSGHGDADDGKAYLLAWDYDPATKAHRLDFNDLREHYIEGAKARKVYGIVDTCHAGEAAGEINPTRRADHVQSGTTLAAQAASTARNLRGGRVVLAAVAGDQAEKEMANLSHSLLTYYLLKGWEDGEATSSDGTLDTELLYSYVVRQLNENYPDAPSPVQGEYLEGTIDLPTLAPAAGGGLADTLALMDGPTLDGIAHRLRHMPNEERALIATAAELTTALRADQTDTRLAALVEAIIAPEGADLLGLQWALAAKCLGPLVLAYPGAEPPVLNDLLGQVRDEVQRRWEASDPLGEVWAKAVLAVTTDSSGNALLGRLQDPATPVAEREHLLRLVAELGSGGGQQAATAALLILFSGPASLYPAAAEAFSRVRPAAAGQVVSALAGHLSSTDAEERRMAAAALAALETTEIGPALDTLKTLAQEPDVSRRSDAVAALGQVAAVGASDLAGPLLVAALADADAAVRAAAVTGLGHLRWDDALPAIIAQAQDPEPRVRIAAAEALGGGHDLALAGAVAPLVTLLGDAHAGVRRAAAEALAALGSAVVLAEPATPVEAPAPPAPDAATPPAAPPAPEASAVPAEAPAPPAPDAATPAPAAEASAAPAPTEAPAPDAGQAAPPDAIGTLSRLLDDPAVGVRGAAAVALARLGHGAGAQARLLEALHGKDQALVLAAGAVLGADPATQPVALPILLNLLTGTDAVPAAQAATALAQPAYLAPLLAQYEAAHDARLLPPLALLARTQNLRLLPGGQVVRADGTQVAASAYTESG